MSEGLSPGRFGPPLRGGRGRVRRVLRRVGVVLAATVGLVGLAGTVTLGALIYTGERSVQRVEVGGTASPGGAEGEGAGSGSALASDGEPELEIEELTDVRNVLVVGSDSRENLTPEQRRAFGTGQDGGVRTDTIMLVRLDPGERSVSVLSFPRDLLVTRCDGTEGKVNAAYWIGEQLGVGGGTCMVQTVSEFSGVPIHHFVKVDFAGFVGLVDTVGGVTMYLDEPIVDERAHIDLPQGCVTLDGIKALGFVRARYLDDDFGRIARQQRFLHELADEVTSARTLVNVPRLFALVDAAARAVETDRDLTLDVARRMAFSLRDAGVDDLDLRTVPSVHRTIDDVWYVVAKDELAEAMFRDFRRGALAATDRRHDGVAEVTVDDVPPVTILNGAGVTGLALETRDRLEREGFQVARVGNAARYGLDTTEILSPDGRLEEAQLLAEVFPDAELLAGRADTELTLTLGADLDPGRRRQPPAALLPQPGERPGVADADVEDEADDEPEYVGARPSEVEC